MPSFIKIFGYNIYFWSNEGKPIEPVHVHISESPNKKGTKVWILSDGSIELADNNSNIKANDLRRILNILGEYSEEIIEMWENYFREPATFYDEEKHIDDEYER